VQLATALLVLLFASSCVVPRPSSVRPDTACSTLTANGIAETIAQNQTEQDWSERIVAAFRIVPEQHTVAKVVGDQEHLLNTYAWETAQARYVMTTKDRSPQCT
jgi:hypothetical protein